MDSSQQPHPAQLFTVRLWQEDLGDGQTDWRGHVQHVTSAGAISTNHLFSPGSCLIWVSIASLASLVKVNPSV